MFSRRAFQLSMASICVCTALYSQAQVTIEPAAPSFQERVHLTVPREVTGPYGRSLVSMSGSTITVSVEVPDIYTGVAFPALDVVLGEFPAGSYDVNVVRHRSDGSSAGTVGTAHFDVPAASTQRTAPLYDYSDLWWNADESGWGLSVTQHPSANLFAVWFVYGSDGKPVWYFIPSGKWSGSTQYSGAVYKTTGPYYGGAFDPSKVVTTPVGAGTILFSDYSNGTFSYTIDGVTSSKQIERQPF